MKTKAALGRFKSDSQSEKPPWLLSKEDIQLANQRIKHILIPSHLDFNPQYLFSNPSRLKSHDWKQVLKNVNYII